MTNDQKINPVDVLAAPAVNENELRKVSGSILKAFTSFLARTGYTLDEVQTEFDPKSTVFRHLDVTYGDVIKLRDALATLARVGGGA